MTAPLISDGCLTRVSCIASPGERDTRLKLNNWTRAKYIGRPAAGVELSKNLLLRISSTDSLSVGATVPLLRARRGVDLQSIFAFARARLLLHVWMSADRRISSRKFCCLAPDCPTGSTAYVFRGAGSLPVLLLAIVDQTTVVGTR